MTQRKKNLVIWGASGHAKVLNEFMGRIGYQVIAVFDNNPEVLSPIASLSIYHKEEGFNEWLAQRPDGEVAGLVAIGGANGQARLDIQRYLVSHQIEPVTAIHPTAFVAESARVGSGSHVLANATVCVDVEIAEACIINTATSIDHECVLGKGVHVAPGAVLTGCITVGDFSFIGAGAVVLPRINIGCNVIIGAGSVVTRDIPDGKVVYGNPAKIVRDNE